MQNNKKVAFLTGITGQDASFLAEQLLEKGYEVHGLVRRTSSFNRERIDHLEDLNLHYGDLTDFSSLVNILAKVKPDEIYNLAAQSHVGISWEIPYYTGEVTGLGVLNLLEAVRVLKLTPKIYHASTSELFSGKDGEAPQNENTLMHPESPYSVAKLYAHEICRVYREAYGMFICRGILFNHESERRGENFVTRKITLGIANIVKGKQKKIYLGDMDIKRDWGYAPDYTIGMWQMLQQDKPDDYILATGQTHSIKEFLEEAFKIVGKDPRDYVEMDKLYIRPNETECLIGDYSKAKEVLGWEPKTSFKELVKIMVEHDLKQQ